ncbi:MAG: glycosyltransferase [Candidatus Hydrogenedentales bacterium]
MNTPDRITVIFVLHALAGGGAERVAVQLLKHLDRRRFRPVLALFRVEGPYLTHVPEDVPVVDLRKRSKMDWPFLVRRLAQLIRREQAPVVFSFDWHANVAAILASKLTWVKTGVIAGVRSHESTYIPQLPRGVQPLRRLTIRKLYPRANVVLSNSEAVRNDLMEAFHLPREQLSMLHNPVDVAAIETQVALPLDDWKIGSGGPLVVAAGRLIPLKGFDVLINAIARVRRELPCTLVILGEGPEEAALKACAVAEGIGDNVVFAGFQANPFNIIRHAQVFVLSSITEGFPNVVLEAMASGTPVVATRCSSGLEEIITDGVDGLLVAPGDAAAMAEAIAGLLSSDERRHAIATAGYARVQAFDLSRTIPAFEDLFARVAQSTSARTPLR